VLSLFEQAAGLLKQLRLRLPNLLSFEPMRRDLLDACATPAQLRRPFPMSFPMYVLGQTLGFSAEDDQARPDAAL
jgi:hypothetical protein